MWAPVPLYQSDAKLKLRLPHASHQTLGDVLSDVHSVLGCVDLPGVNSCGNRLGKW